MTRKQLRNESIGLIVLVTAMVYLPLLVGGDTPSDTTVLLFAIGWVIVTALRYGAVAAWHRRRA